MPSSSDLFEHFGAPAVETGLLPAMLADRYALRSVIGQGGMAVVMIADDCRDLCQVAVKVLHPQLAGDHRAKERFEVEVEAARVIDHPSVVRFVGAGDHQGLPYMVMELVRGPSLADLVAERGPLVWPLALELIKQAAGALETMHNHGLIHRDAKPANLLLQMEGLRPTRLKVADMGFVRIGDKRITEAGNTVGTSSYMAPEQVLADTVDPRTDVYALGICLFFALTGELPYQGTAGQVMFHQLRSAAPPPSWLVEQLDDGCVVDQIVGTALRKAPENRYPRMAAFRQDLERALGQRTGEPRGAPLQVEPDTYVPTTELGRNVLEALTNEYL
ncbi:MAG: serine/threonine protein kinase [Deltaproteobacteria bacterium]|nr:serine/threonine protein kinase [Deltaproteobacteria bacterium]